MEVRNDKTTTDIIVISTKWNSESEFHFIKSELSSKVRETVANYTTIHTNYDDKSDLGNFFVNVYGLNIEIGLEKLKYALPQSTVGQYIDDIYVARRTVTTIVDFERL